MVPRCGAVLLVLRELVRGFERGNGPMFRISPSIGSSAGYGYWPTA